MSKLLGVLLLAAFWLNAKADSCGGGQCFTPIPKSSSFQTSMPDCDSYSAEGLGGDSSSGSPEGDGGGNAKSTF